MNLIVATDKNFGIGRENDLLTYLPEDLEFFKQKTVGKTLVIGRKTLESFKNGKPLPKRHHIVLSRKLTYDHDRVKVVSSIEKVLQEVKKYNEGDVYVAGGGMIYEALLPYCKKAYITMINADLNPEIYMPNMNEESNWHCIDKGEILMEGDIAYRHTVWENRAPKKYL